LTLDGASFLRHPLKTARIIFSLISSSKNSSVVIIDSISSASFPSAPSPVNPVIKKNLRQFSRNAGRNRLRGKLLIDLLSYAVAHELQHPSVRIFVIDPAALIVENIQFLFHHIPDPSGSIRIPGSQQIGFFFLQDLLLKGGGITVRPVKRHKIILKHRLSPQVLS